tara:strand:- start:188 stop:487 length:300 start_codon:yes stop_codon:yes gene_type:complete
MANKYYLIPIADTQHTNPTGRRECTIYEGNTDDEKIVVRFLDNDDTTQLVAQYSEWVEKTTSEAQALVNTNIDEYNKIDRLLTAAPSGKETSEKPTLED